MKVKVNPEWFRENVIRTQPEERKNLWWTVAQDHNFIWNFEYEVRIRETNELYGVRVGIRDSRLYRNKLYITPTVGNYEIIEE